MPRKLSLIALFLIVLTAVVPAPSAGAADLENLIAPVSACPGQTDPRATIATRERAMRCLSNFARQRVGLRPVGGSRVLDRSAGDKSDDILRCDSFSHFACGRDFTYWMQRVGYIPAPCWRVGENIAWGAGTRGKVRPIFRAWMRSPEHRENILGRYSQIGIGLAVGTLAGSSRALVWTQHFGSHCGQTSRSAPRLAGLADRRAVD